MCFSANAGHICFIDVKHRLLPSHSSLGSARWRIMITPCEPNWCTVCTKQKHEPNLIFVRTKQQYRFHCPQSVQLSISRWSGLSMSHNWSVQLQELKGQMHFMFTTLYRKFATSQDINNFQAIIKLPLLFLSTSQYKSLHRKVIIFCMFSCKLWYQGEGFPSIPDQDLRMWDLSRETNPFMSLH